MNRWSQAPDEPELARRVKGDGEARPGPANRTAMAWLALGVASGVLVTALVFFYSGRTGARPIYITPPAPVPSPQPSSTPSPVRVYISGAVARPAVYALPAHSIVEDLVEAAGGLTEAADGRLVNLAQPLTDGLHIHVPAEGEPVSMPDTVGRAPAAVDLSARPLDLNTAAAVELELLPGIGPALAQRIVDYREANGPFAQVEDVVNVSGIGPATLDKIKDLVTVGR
jgi:competence protein ComEA